jgi:hypothetical protein
VPEGSRDPLAESGLEAVIGLEIHVQLSTRTKMFCGCALSFGDEPNVHTCPVCLAHPGVLPVPNEEAIRYALKIGAALECEVAARSIFHRKNYFYPDNAKAYQISQYDIPICSGGRLGDVRIHRAHLEEDAAKMVHVGESGRIHGSGASLVDFNRGGTPLDEIVTEPDLRSAGEAASLDVRLVVEGPHAVLSVADTGIGIAPEDQGRIFERFYRVDKARSRQLGGTGLGLSIAKHVALSHGGNISLKSTPGRGTTFRVQIPLARENGGDKPSV